MARRRSARRMEIEELRSLHVPGYKILKKLGDGGEGKVYLAVRGENAENDVDDAAEQVALKIYHGENARQSFQKEVRVLRALQGHCNIIGLFEEFEGDQGPMAAFELCKTDLHTYSYRRHLSESDALSIMRGATRALEYVHDLEIVHKDVKPENIAIGSDDSARLIDFGMAARLSDEVEMSNRCGTLGYMAPELFFNDVHGLPVDLFALGATLFFILGKQYALAAPGMTYEYVSQKINATALHSAAISIMSAMTARS
eukprot:TRINITY_DN24477_c0_g1_i1.p1 TRINITY_DN24477_c0_g1~~TRINITY_DN24477_c0_g1_i1.p1  ORF type:complete len:266 (-),score=51.71 TRINITY_DN24477_c0_g1_i1:1152-1922(-)